MAVTSKDETVSRRLMFLCLGAAIGLLVYWGMGTRSRLAQPSIAHPAPAKPIAAPLASQSKLIVDLSDRRVYVVQQQRRIASYAIAIGQKGWETPRGTFRVTQMQQDPTWIHPITHQVMPAGGKNPLGKRWIGFWSGKSGAIGFHGTPQENSIGWAVSHGCIRMRNRDVQKLYQQVTVGSVVEVRP